MARFKPRGLGLATVLAIAIGFATFALWQERPMTVQAAQESATYTVKGGDSLYSIAHKLGISVIALADANGLAINTPLSRGLALIIPTSSRADDAAQATGNAPAAAAAQEEAAPAEEVAEEEATAAAETSAAPADAEISSAASMSKTYRVKAGDSLTSIAKKFRIPRNALAAANNLDPNAILLRGLTLIIPSTDTPATPAVPPPAAPEAVTESAEATPEATEQMAEEVATPEATEEMVEEVVTPEATAEVTEEATTPEATEEMAEEAVTPEATEEMTEEAATPESTEEMTEEAATPEATEEMAEEVVTPEATEEMTEEEATPEATEEMAEEEATPEATEEIAEEEATPEPTAEPTEEMTEEPTTTPTEEMAEEANLLDTISEMGDFTVLLNALTVAGLDDTLTTEGPFTLFAPSDAAFAALPEGAIEGLLASSPDDLSQILLYHLVSGEVHAEDFVDGVTVITAQGGTIILGVGPDGLTVNGAKIITSDIETSNGVIHVIDTVLLPTAGVAAAPPGTTATPQLEAASNDAASVIIAPESVADMAAAAHNWPWPVEAIALLSPVATGGYHSPLNIIGLAQTFGGHIALNLTAPDGTVLAQRMTLGGEDNYAFFQSSLRFHVDEVTEAILSAHEVDLADGTLLYTTETPVTLLPGQRFVDVNSPAIGAMVCDPILVSGYSNTFEGNVVLSLYTPEGELLTQLPTIGGTMGFYRDFATPLPYPKDVALNQATPLLVSVTETDAAGILTTIDETRIPVTLYPRYSAVCY